MGNTYWRRCVRAAWFVLVVTWLAVGYTSIGYGQTDAKAGQLIRFGYSSQLMFDVPTKDAQAALELWSRELIRMSNYAGRTLVYDTSHALVDAATRDEVDLMALSTLDYLRIADHTPIEPAMVGKRGSGAQEEHVLVVRRDSGISQIEGIRSKKIVIPVGTVGELSTLWLDTLLFRRGLPETARYVAEVTTAAKSQQALLAVFFGRIDAAVVTQPGFVTAAELNPQIGQQLVTIETSPSLLLALTCFRKGLSAQQRQFILGTSLNLKNSATGRQILMLFKIREIMSYTPDAVEPTAGLLREYTALQRKRGAR